MEISEQYTVAIFTLGLAVYGYAWSNLRLAVMQLKVKKSAVAVQNALKGL